MAGQGKAGHGTGPGRAGQGRAARQDKARQSKAGGRVISMRALAPHAYDSRFRSLRVSGFPNTPQRGLGFCRIPQLILDFPQAVRHLLLGRLDPDPETTRYLKQQNMNPKQELGFWGIWLCVEFFVGFLFMAEVNGKPP